MTFESAKALRSATGRAKSDVANKLISMFLHEISRRICIESGITIASPTYISAVEKAFGNRCLYCGLNLEHDRASVEHLDGMNRFRVGLHVPGNVAVSCRKCNNEKRRDDQKPQLTLAQSGWESFLSHNGMHCLGPCKSCDYWKHVWPDDSVRTECLAQSRDRILHFRTPFFRFVQWSENARGVIHEKVEDLYRSCQDFATTKIQSLTTELNLDFHSLIEIECNSTNVEPS